MKQIILILSVLLITSCSKETLPLNLNKQSYTATIVYKDVGEVIINLHFNEMTCTVETYVYGYLWSTETEVYYIEADDIYFGLNGKGYFAQNTLFLRLNNSSAMHKFMRYDTR